MEIARSAEAGEVRTAFEERMQARDAALKVKAREEAREECLKEERELLTRVARQRFGSETANDLERHLEAITEHEQLLTLCDWILDCTSGSELLGRVQAEF